MSSQTGGPFARAAVVGCAKAKPLGVIAVLAVTPGVKRQKLAARKFHDEAPCQQQGYPNCGVPENLAHVRFWHKADIPSCTAHVRFRG